MKIEICKIVGILFILQTKKAQDFAIVIKVVKNIGYKLI